MLATAKNNNFFVIFQEHHLKPTKIPTPLTTQTKSLSIFECKHLDKILVHNSHKHFHILSSEFILSI